MPLWRRLETARAACEGVLLVVDTTMLPAPPSDAGAEQLHAPFVPPGAVRNLTPYRPPRPVVAAGGYVMRPSAGGPELLVIFRRGVWDLPKGKLDDGESVEAAALREVREEVGLEALHLRRSLGRTEHGYPEGTSYRIKTTHWFLMETSDAGVSPQAEEGIEEAVWLPWEEARSRIGFRSLRAHLDAAEPLLRQEAWLGW